MGSKVHVGQAVMIDNGQQGVLWVRGTFNRKDKCMTNPYFKLTLTSHVSSEDFQLGYSMTGVVERSLSKYMNFQTTHLAFVRRSQHEQCNKHDTNMPSSSNKNNHFSFLPSLTGKMIPINHIHQLDNQFHSVRKLPHNFSDH